MTGSAADTSPLDAAGERGSAEPVEAVATVDLIPVEGDVLTLAGALPMTHLRTLDAVHVASSLLLADLGLFVSYDPRQLRAAAEAGMAIASPGRS
jgi:uncharacterized protein